MSDLRYPVGRFERPQTISSADMKQWMDELERLPAALRQATDSLSEQQLETPYRPGGWTVRQVVHHVADSHLNSYTRFRLALTENVPTIKPYDQAAWANLYDAQTAPLDVSLQLLDALHTRWVLLLRSLTDEQWRRIYEHPENGPMSLNTTLGLYAWHSRHHLAHIRELRMRERW